MNVVLSNVSVSVSVSEVFVFVFVVVFFFLFFFGFVFVFVFANVSERGRRVRECEGEEGRKGTQNQNTQSLEFW